MRPQYTKCGHERQPIYSRSLQIIVTAPVLLDLLLCHSRAWLPREESRSFLTSARSNFSVIPARVSGAREESRIPLEDVRVTILRRTQISGTGFSLCGRRA